MAKRWIVTALGQDRPGIVSGVTEALYRMGCNLEDSAMTRLEGEFAIMLIFSSPPGKGQAVLERGFRPLERRLKLAIHLKPLAGRETASPKASGTPFMVSVYGADRPGIVFHVSKALAAKRLNITDVQTHRSVGRKGGRSLYMLLLEVEAPPRAASSLKTMMKRLAQQLGVTISVREADADVL